MATLPATVSFFVGDWLVDADCLPRFLLIDAGTKVALGSLTAAHRNYLGGRSVPFSAFCYALLSVYIGENRHSKMIFQRQKSTRNGH